MKEDLLICEKRNSGPICQQCKHSILHKRMASCKGDICLAYCVAFANDNKECSTCLLKEECYQFTDGSNINLFNRGEECHQYSQKRLYCKCKPDIVD